MRNVVLLVIVAGAIVIGCGDLFGPDDEVMAAIVLAEYGWPENVPDVRAPDTVFVDQWFQVQIQTYRGCLLEDGRTDLELRNLRAEIIPYMRYIGPGNCPDVLHGPIRTVRLRFSSSGLASVKVVGLDAIRFPSQQEQNPANEVRVVRQIMVTRPRPKGDR